MKTADSEAAYDNGLSPASIVCEICQSLSPRSKYGLSLYIEDIENSAEGCTTCKLILECIEPFRNKITFLVDINAATADGEPCTIQLTESDDNGDHYDELFYEVYISPHSTVEWPIFLSPPNCREVSADSSSDDCLDLARGWILNCCASHTSCKYELSTLPKRVIRVGADYHDLLLHVSSGQVGKYAALSHCWGGEQPQKTTSMNVDSRKNGMSFFDLPKTFQDAIVITWKLGLEYIWIDSLCIVQDSPDDWRFHVATMASIYRDAYVTIAAAGAESSEKGCFLAHDTHEAKVLSGDGICVHIRPYRLNQGLSRNLESEHEGANYAPCHSSTFDCFNSPSTPLESRAWAFQERILSPRTLHFTKDELVFECREMICCECRMRPEEYGPSNVSFKTLAVNKSASVPTDGAETHARGLREWTYIIQQYSSRSLTVPTDKLPALAGIVNEFETQFNLRGDYKAGLWEQHMPLALLWSPVASLNHTVMTYPCHDRYPYYIAPTWSWASLSGPVKYPDVIFGPHTLLTTLSRVYVKPEEPVSNPHGAVKNGAIVLNGLLIEVVTDWEPIVGLTGGWKCRFSDANVQVEPDMMAQLNESISFIIPDVQDSLGLPVEVPVGGRVYLMPIVHVHMKQNDKQSYEGLALQRLAKTDIYKRVGTFRITCNLILRESWRLIARERKIIIV